MKKKPTMEKFLNKVESMLDIEAIQVLLNDMQELLMKAGIGRKSIEQYIKIGEDKLEKYKEYLINLYKNEYFNYRKAYNVLPPHAWEHYELIGIEDMNEQVALRKKAEQLRKAWKERPKREKKKV